MSPKNTMRYSKHEILSHFISDDPGQHAPLIDHMRKRIVEHYGLNPKQPSDYVKGAVEVHGLHPKKDNKWLFKVLVNEQIAKKVSKENYMIAFKSLPMLQGFSEDNHEYQFVALSAAVEYIDDVFKTELYVQCWK